MSSLKKQSYVMIDLGYGLETKKPKTKANDTNCYTKRHRILPRTVFTFSVYF